MPTKTEELAKRVTKLEENQEEIYKALGKIADNLTTNSSAHALFLEFFEKVDAALTELERKLDQRQ